MSTSRLHRLADAISQVLNVLIFNGEANHSVSGDAYRLGRARLESFIDRAFALIEDHHCYKSHMADVERAQRLLEEEVKKWKNL